MVNSLILRLEYDQNRPISLSSGGSGKKKSQNQTPSPTAARAPLKSALKKKN
jgi:hypothetical protein